MMVFVFLVLAAGLGTALYLLIMFTSIPGAVDERLGTLDALPDNLGQWIIDRDSETARAASAGGRQREVRLLHRPATGLFGREALIEQVRYRDLASGEISQVEPERRIPRQRSKG